MDAETKNPITELRGRLNLSRAELARATNASYGMLSHAELGYFPQLPPSVLDALERVGVERVAAQVQYRAWRKGRTRTFEAPVAEVGEE